MIKRLLFCAALATSVIGAVAQVTVPKGTGAFSKSADRIAIGNSAAKHAPAKAASLDDTMQWGYCSTEDETGGVGIGSATTYWAGYYVPGDGVLKGAYINGISVPFSRVASMTEVSVWISEDLETDVVTKSVARNSLKANAYNDIALDEPYAIPESGVFVGVKFRINNASATQDKYPVLCGGEGGYPYSCLLKYGSYDWGDYSNAGWGAFAMQLYCSNLSVPETFVYPLMASGTSSLKDTDLTIPVVLSSDGSTDVNSIDYTVDVNGTKYSNHLDLATPISAGFNRQAQVNFNFKSPSTVGAYSTKITVDKVNGVDNAASTYKLDVNNKVLSRVVSRRTVVEEFTGTECQYCPRGWAGMETLKEKRENFIGIAFHQYNAPGTSDPMYVANYYSASKLGISGAPGCAMDRLLLGIDPYYGSSNSVLDDFDYCSSIIPDVDVAVAGAFNADGTSVDAHADVEYLIDGGKYSVAFVLTADGLTGTTSAWKQINAYAQGTAAQWGITEETDPLLAKFCRGGEYGQTSVLLTYNDVMIGSSYSTAGKNLAPELSGEPAVGSVGHSSYSVAMPTKVALKSAINPEEVYIVALVIDETTGTIANAARAKVMSYEDFTAGIGAVSDASATAVEVARFNAAGQCLTAPQKGINIVKYSDGRTVKLNIK